VKNYIKTICQLPAVSMLFLIVLIEQGLTWCLIKLGNPLCPFALSALKRIVREPEPEKNDCSAVPDVRSNVSVFRDWLKDKDDNFIETYRISIENEFGVPAWGKDKDSHLYAVRRPNREENIRRIAYALSTMKTFELQQWLSERRELLK